MQLTKLLENIAIDDAVSIAKEAIEKPDHWVKTLKDNQQLWWFISKLYATAGNEDIKQQFNDKVIHPSRFLKEQLEVVRIMKEIDETQLVAEQEWWNSTIKIIKTVEITKDKTMVVLGIPYKEDKWPIKYKYTLIYWVNDRIVKELVKKYDRFN